MTPEYDDQNEEQRLVRGDAKFDQELAAVMQWAQDDMESFADYCRMVNKCAVNRDHCEIMRSLLAEDTKESREGLYLILRMANLGFMFTAGRLLERDI